jgi:hypothetical protein
MKRIDRYNEHLLEKEFKTIIANIFLIVESQTSDNTFEWDIAEPNFDTGEIEQKKKLKDYIDFVKAKAKSFKSYLNEPDPDIHLEIIPVERLKELLKKVVEMSPSKEEAIAKIKEYFDKFVYEIKSLPYEIKKGLLKKFLYVFMSFAPLISLITDESIAKEPVLKDVKSEMTNNVKEKSVEKKKTEYSSFKVAQEGVHKVEGVYTEDNDDKGNWTLNEIGAGKLLGTKYGIAAPTLVSYYQKNDLGVPTKSDMEELTYEMALDIYKKDYWDKQQLQKFKSQSLANVLYDGCVNQGPNATLDILNESLEDVDMDSTNINSWNDFHDVLIDEVNELPVKKTKKLFDIIKNKRWEKYQLGKKKYHGGWKNRLDSITFIDNNDTENSDMS